MLQDQALIDCKWLYKLKYSSVGDVTRIFNARLMVRGFTQEKGLDYKKFFSLVTKYATICIVDVLTAIVSIVIDKMDVIIAFFYGHLEEEIHIRQAVGFEVKVQAMLVCRLLKSLYELRKCIDCGICTLTNS